MTLIDRIAARNTDVRVYPMTHTGWAAGFPTTVGGLESYCYTVWGTLLELAGQMVSGYDREMVSRFQTVEAPNSYNEMDDQIQRVMGALDGFDKEYPALYARIKEYSYHFLDARLALLICTVGPPG